MLHATPSFPQVIHERSECIEYESNPPTIIRAQVHAPTN